MQKAAVDKEWKKLETISAWQLEKFKSKKRGYSGSETKRKSTLQHCDGRMSPQECGVKFVFRGDIVKRRHWILESYFDETS